MTAKDKNWLKIAGVGLGAFILYKLVTPKIDNSGGNYDPTGNGTGPSGNNPNFNAANVAENLYDVMKTMGTPENDILVLLTGLSQEQFGQVAAKFGKRSYNKTLGNQYNFNPFSNLPLEPLKVWLKTELSTDQYALLRKKYPLYL